MDHPADLLPTGPARTPSILVRLAAIALRCGTATVRGAAAATGWIWTDLLPWLLPFLARRVARALRHPSAATVARLAVAISWRLAVVAVLALAILLVTAAPAYAAGLAEAGLWTLPPSLEGPRRELPSSTAALVVASIVVLAVVSSHSDHHHHDHW